MLIKFIIVILRCVDHISSLDSVVGLEWAGPGVGGGIVFPLSVSVGFAFKLLFSDVFISVSDVDGRDSGDKGNKGEFHL